MPDLELEIESHTYSLNGVIIPGCTNVLSAMGATPNFNFMSKEDLLWYQDRGRQVHKMIEMYIKGTLDKRLPGDLKPYLAGWQRFCDDYGVTVIEHNGEPFVERMLDGGPFRYGVTPDVAVKITKGKTHGTGACEIKATSAHGPATGLQTSAQLRAIRRVIPSIGDLRCAVRLIPKEPFYEPMFYNERSDDSVWLGMLSSYNWLTDHKMLKERNGNR